MTTTPATQEILGQDKNLEYLEIAVKPENKFPVLCVGETGTGKTSSITQVAKKHGKKSIRFSLTGETTTNEIVGRYELAENETVWVDGPLLDAMQNGHWFVADEMNMALPEILSLLHPLLDHDRMIVVTQRNGQVVKPHEDFRFFATMNPVNEYAGTKELNKAFMSRFPMILEFEYPDVETEARIIHGHSQCNDNVALALAETAAILRKAKEDSAHFYTCSTRDLIYCGQLVAAGLDLADALNVSILNRVEDDGQREVVHELCSTKINDIFAWVKENKIQSFIEHANEQHKILDVREKELAEKEEKMKADLTEKITTKITARLAKDTFEADHIAINKKDPVLNIDLLDNENVVSRPSTGEKVSMQVFTVTAKGTKKDTYVTHLALAKETLSKPEREKAKSDFKIQIFGVGGHSIDQTCEACENSEAVSEAASEA